MYTNTIERWTIGDDKWLTIQTNGDFMEAKYCHKSVQVDDDFILVFGGGQDQILSSTTNNTCHKFYPGNNQLIMAEAMAAKCGM